MKRKSYLSRETAESIKELIHLGPQLADHKAGNGNQAGAVRVPKLSPFEEVGINIYSGLFLLLL